VPVRKDRQITLLPKVPRNSAKGEVAGNFVAEWFGHRVFPVVAGTAGSIDDQRTSRCPFLSGATGSQTKCIKSERSRGICTISSPSAGARQDWLVCPLRGLDPDLLEDAVRRMYNIPLGEGIQLVAAPALVPENRAAEFRAAALEGKPSFVYFQNKLGGEISISPTARSPEFSFDVTIAHVVAESTETLGVGRYAVFEIQTMDFHGGYSAAVSNLRNALHLHGDNFPAAVEHNPQWLSERVQSPNIANVFKRTFYQMMFKFQVGAHGQSAGCVLAIPRPVWESWQRHLGAPELAAQPDGTWRLWNTTHSANEVPRAWIYVFDLDVSATTSPNQIRLLKVIGTDAPSLSHYALDVAPSAALEAGGSVDRLLDTIRTRLSRYLVDFQKPRRGTPLV